MNQERKEALDAALKIADKVDPTGGYLISKSAEEIVSDAEVFYQFLTKDNVDQGYYTIYSHSDTIYDSAK
jgi:hypothetical protein